MLFDDNNKTGLKYGLVNSFLFYCDIFPFVYQMLISLAWIPQRKKMHNL